MEPSARPWTGRVALVTGGTSGLGHALALRLAREGATTVIVGRGAGRAESAAAEIAATAGMPPVAPIAIADLAERSDQRRVVAEVRRRFSRLDWLVNNAGALYARRSETTDGLERTFALNVLAPFALTQGLEDLLRATPGSRVVNLASAAHRGQTLDLTDLQLRRRYSGWRAYGRSKLALILLTREFARRFGPGPPTVHAVHPGFVRTGFAQNNAGLTAVTVRFAGWIGGRGLSRGVETPLYVATDPRVGAESGRYFSDRAVRAGSAASRDPELARRLFEACEAIDRAR